MPVLYCLTVPYACVAEVLGKLSSESRDPQYPCSRRLWRFFQRTFEMAVFRIDNPRHRLRRLGNNDGVMLGLDGAVVASLDNSPVRVFRAISLAISQ